MKIQTNHFGTIEVKENEIINFPEGLPGFTKVSKYTVVKPEDSAPFMWLQSIERADVSFVLVNPKEFRPNYKAVANDDDLKMIQLENPEQAKIYCLVTLSEDPEEVSMNLKGPIVINEDKKLGVQVILRDSDYDIEYKMFAPPKKTELRYQGYESSISSNYSNDESTLNL